MCRPMHSLSWMNFYLDAFPSMRTCLDFSFVCLSGLSTIVLDIVQKRIESSYT